MKNHFLFKIWSGYDGFRPTGVPSRKVGGLLELGWGNYVDEVELNDNVWVYFYGPGVPTPSVYVKGLVKRVDRPANTVYLKPVEESTTVPLVDDKTAGRVAQVVGQRGRQVFAMPLELAAMAHGCDLDSGGSSCLARNCDQCPNWVRYPLIDPADFHAPARLNRLGVPLVSAYWIIPRRCYLGADVRKEIADVTRHFMNLKTGDRSKAFPFAWGLSRQLGTFDVEVDEVVSIPLSPDKAKAGEVPRTKLLAQELAQLIGVPYRDRLQLTKPISKRRLPWSSFSISEYEHAYLKAMKVASPSSLPRRVLVVDDVCTRGATMAAAVRALRSSRSDVDVVAGTAGLMIVKETVVDDSSLRRRRVKVGLS